MFKSKYKPPQNIDKRIEKIEITSKVKLSSSYLDFLKKFNVIDFDENYVLKLGTETISIELIFGFSELKKEDIEAVSLFYKNRIPSTYLPIAAINSGDIACITSQGKIYHWNHEINDLYFNKEPNTYQQQDVKLPLIAESFDKFLKLISINDDVEEKTSTEYDVYMDTTVAFPDQVLNIFFKNPKLFFSNDTQNRVQIYLKKLELSEKGKELLILLKKEGLI